MPVSVNDLNQEPSKGHMPRPAGGTSRARLNLAHEQRCPTSISRRFSLSHSSSWNVDRQRLIVANEVARAPSGGLKHARRPAANLLPYKPPPRPPHSARGA